jgi:hypothetical protein
MIDDRIALHRKRARGKAAPPLHLVAHLFTLTVLTSSSLFVLGTTNRLITVHEDKNLILYIKNKTYSIRVSVCSGFPRIPTVQVINTGRHMHSKWHLAKTKVSMNYATREDGAYARRVKQVPPDRHRRPLCLATR